MLELILNKLTNMESILVNHTEQLQIIKEQTARNAELEPVVQKLVKDVKNLETDVHLMKRAFRN